MRAAKFFHEMWLGSHTHCTCSPCLPYMMHPNRHYSLPSPAQAPFHLPSYVQSDLWIPPSFVWSTGPLGEDSPLAEAQTENSAPHCHGASRCGRCEGRVHVSIFQRESGWSSHEIGRFPRSAFSTYLPSLSVSILGCEPGQLGPICSPSCLSLLGRT